MTYVYIRYMWMPCGLGCSLLSDLPCEARVVSQAEFRSRDLLLELDDATCRT